MVMSRLLFIQILIQKDHVWRLCAAVVSRGRDEYNDTEQSAQHRMDLVVMSRHCIVYFLTSVRVIFTWLSSATNHF